MPFRKHQSNIVGCGKDYQKFLQFGSKPEKLPGKGEFPIGIFFAYGGFKQKSEGEPVMVAFPKEGSGYDVESNP